jgi:hypothetical protein
MAGTAASPSEAALAAREVDVALRDGAPVHVRPVRPDDLPALRAFLGALSPSSRQLRWFTGAAEGLGHRCFASVEEIPAELDAAVLAVPAHQCIPVARACAARGVRGLVVLAAGFSETGPAGASMQRELLAVCRAGRMRLVGPNCLGVIDTDPEVRLDASFAPGAPPVGQLGLLSQSGGVGIALLEQAQALGIGLSAFVSVGNKADLSGNDFLEWRGRSGRAAESRPTVGSSRTTSSRCCTAMACRWRSSGSSAARLASRARRPSSGQGRLR